MINKRPGEEILPAFFIELKANQKWLVRQNAVI
jgi:hypothetical protein